MRNRLRKTKRSYFAILGAAPLLLIGAGARAQTQPAPDNKTFQDDANRGELSQFDQFLDSHQEIAKQLQQDPSLANNPQFLNSHPDLQAYLSSHPGIQDDLRHNPNAFLRQENNLDRNDARFGNDGRPGNDARYDNDGRRAQLAEFDRFLDSHPEIAEQVRKDPSLADNQQFLKTHPALQTYLQDQPAIRQDLRQDPNAFMRQEDNFDRNEVRLNYDANRDQRAEFDRFLNDHREIGEQLRKNPSLADNQQFLKTHPALQAYLQNQPAIRQDLRQDPNAFMRQEDALNRDNGGNFRRDDDRSASFHAFLGGHRDINDQLSKNPYLVKDHDYVKDHPELQAYLNSRPDVREQLMNNPQELMNGQQENKTGQQYSKPTGTTGSSTGNSTGTGSSKPSPAAGTSPTTNPGATTTAPAPTPWKNGDKQ